jgi:hypothetical protein
MEIYLNFSLIVKKKSGVLWKTTFCSLASEISGLFKKSQV